MKKFYVTAIEGQRVFRLADPYDSLDDAKVKVETVRKIACDFKRNTNAGRAAFMAYGVTGIDGIHKTALGVI